MVTIDFLQFSHISHYVTFAMILLCMSNFAIHYLNQGSTNRGIADVMWFDQS